MCYSPLILPHSIQLPSPTLPPPLSYSPSQLAFKYLSWVLLPLLVAYAVYSLLYEEHKGWYSWTLSMCYGYLLLFGQLCVCVCLSVFD